MAISGVNIGAEVKFKSLLADSCKQHCHLMALVDIKALKKTGEELETRYWAEKQAIIALERLLEDIDARLQLTLLDRQSQFKGRVRELVKQVKQKGSWPSVQIENILKSINTADFQIISSSKETEMEKFEKLCGCLFATLKTEYFEKAALRSKTINQEDVRCNVYDSEAGHESNIYLGVREAIASVNSINSGKIKQYIIYKTAEVIKKSVPGLWPSFEYEAKEILDGLARDNESLFAGAAGLSKTATLTYPQKLDFAVECIAQMEKIVAFVTNPPKKIVKAPTRESPGEYELLPCILNNDGLTVTDTKFADDTYVHPTAWGVSEDLLRCFVGMAWHLGAEIKTRLDCAIRPDLVGISCTELGVETVVNLIEYCESILEGVLQRNNDGTYVLEDTDPLSVDRICELLGLLKAMVRQIPEQCFSKNFMGRGTTILVDRIVIQKIGEQKFINLQALVAIAKNTVIGYCNTYYSVCDLEDDLNAAKTEIEMDLFLKKATDSVEKSRLAEDKVDIHDSGRFVKIEQLHQKTLNRFRGYINTLVIYHKSSWLPLRSQDRSVGKQNIVERCRIREKVKERMAT